MDASGNNRFTVTCGLLRQYMRERKDLQSPPRMDSLAGSFVLPPQREATEEAEETDSRTMQLFPTHAGTSQPSQKRADEQASAPAPLTIFYEGRLLVFEDFPADKAKELMQLAGSGPLSAPKNEVPVVPKKPAATGPSWFATDLPIARKASLKRFLQKRKHRIITTDHKENIAPAGKEAADDKPVNGEPAASWLAL